VRHRWTARHNPTLFVFAYDWRLSNAENAVKLAAYTECVRAFYPKTKIDILAHSMGGMLARRFVLDNSDHGVSKFVTIGSPLLGAPKALDVMYTGEFFDVFFADVWLRSKIKVLAAYSKGIHELLPSREYFRLGGNPLVEKMSPKDESGRNFDFEGMFNVLGTQFPLSNPQLNVDTLHTHHGQDDWRVPDGFGIKYKHIYGVRKKADTMRALVVRREQRARKPLFKKEGIKQTLGDGTVPVLSAARKTEIDNLNAHGEGDVFAVYSLDSNGGDAALTHTKLTSHSDVLNKVWSFLGIKQQPPSDVPLRAKSNRKRSTAMTKADEAPPGVGSPVDIYYLSVDGVAGDIVDLADTNGSVLRQVTDVGRVLDREGYSMRFSGEISRDFEYPADTTVTLTFRTVDFVTVELLRGKRQDEPNSVVRHIQVPLPAGALVEIKTTPQGMELRYDADGDGICETEVPPTLVVTGEAARDITDPDVSIRVARQGTGSLATISIEAKDDETGIRSVRYWYDGDGEESDREYTGPFTVDSANAPSVFAVAWDNAGNNTVKERKIDFTLPSSSATLSPIADAYVKGSTPDVNFGAAIDLQVKRTLNPGTGKGRQAYLRFDTSSVTGNVTRAVLRVYGNLNATIGANNNLPCAVFPVSAAWDETTLVWNNKPAPNVPNELARVVVTDTTARWYEFDITSFINAERAAGRSLTGVLLRNMEEGEPGDYFTVFNSREATQNRPQLVIEK
jgi:hypothetical protein